MAASNEISSRIGDIFSGLFSQTVGIAIWVLIGFMFLGIVGGIIWYYGIYRKKFDISAKIISERASDNYRVFFDKAAILNDKKNSTYYLKLLKTGVELALPKFNVFHHTNKGDYVEILRKSEKDFRFLTPPKIDKEYFIRSSGRLYPMSSMKQREIENDISWIINRQKTNKKIIDPESMLMKLLAYMPQILSMAFTLILVIYVFKLMPELLGAMQHFAETIKEDTEPVVIGSLIPLIRIWKKNR